MIKNLRDCSLAHADVVLPALAAAESLLSGEYACPIPFKRNFAAVVIATQLGERIENGSATWEEFYEHIIWEAWLGDESAYREATYDYMCNARHKAFTSWRLEDDNGSILWHHRHKCVPEDSVWPGAVWVYYGKGQGLVVATSGLLPEQDAFISRLVIYSMKELRSLSSFPNLYKHLYPEKDVDTIGGESFNRPPTFE